MTIHHLLVGRCKCSAIIGTEIGRSQHSCDHHCDVLIFCGKNDPLEIFLELLGRQGAQRVVAAELDQQMARPIGQHPSDPRRPTGARIAGNAGIDDRTRKAARAQGGLEAGRKRLARRQTEAGCEQIAQNRDPTPFR